MNDHSAGSIIRFDGQVAIVTGAGGGLGFAIAQELARRGAAVLVNDYGGSVQGEGGSADRAEAAAAMLRADGGHAVANSIAVGTPESARAIVAHAMATFGKVDILVNNAGIARPCAFTDATDDNLALEFRTNLLGPYALMRAVWDGMAERRHGRILNVSSNATFGIGHNASYATTKAGLLGLTLDTAAEGKPLGIHVNVLMPVAYTRMIEGIPDPDFVAWFRKHMAPEKVAATVAFYLSRESDVTGHILSSGGGRLSRIVFASTPGFVGAKDAETTRDHLGAALGTDQLHPIESSAAELALYSQVFPFDGQGGKPALQADAVVGAGRAATSD
jgi:NAD(P)-dependent dehydrogenase (short-subunit alcohol dehydrogenase family)